MGNNNAFATSLAGMMIHAQNITNTIKTGEGITFDPDPEKNEEKKKEFVAQMNRPENQAKVQELAQQMEKLKSVIKSANNVSANQANR